MKSNTACVLACVVAMACAAYAGPYEVIPTTEPIVVDGKMDEAVWEKAEPITDFIRWWTADTKAATRTAARLCSDENYIYAFFECDDPDLFTKYDQRDGYLWESDVVEFFFQPDAECTMYYEIEAAPNGAILDARFPRVGAPGGINRWSQWNCNIKIAVQVNGTLNDGKDKDKGYTVEMAIPRETFIEVIGDAPLEGQTWRFAAVRMELSTWEAEAQLPLFVAKEGRERMSNVPCADGNLHAKILEKNGWATLTFK